MPAPIVDWLLILDDGPFWMHRFTLPQAIIAPGLSLQVIRGEQKVQYTVMNIDHQTNTVIMEQA